MYNIVHMLFFPTWYDFHEYIYNRLEKIDILPHHFLCYIYSYMAGGRYLIITPYKEL